MDLHEEGKHLLKTHQELFSKLVQIPSSRQVIYRIETKNSYLLAKPRFSPEKYEWPVTLFSQVRDHLQSIWEFFDTYSFWFDDISRAILENQKRRLSKKSVIFLLENDIWCTDEVFGDYLIERTGNDLTISYYRRNQRRKQFHLDSLSDEEIKDWICEDVIKQIIDQFSFLWTHLQTEIEICLLEKYTRLSTTIKSPEYTKTQCNLIEPLLNSNLEAALLCLGRVAELWVLQILGKKKRNYGENIIRKAQVNGLVNTSQVKLLNSIKKEYNLLKHTSNYTPDKTTVETLWKKLKILFKVR